MQRPSRRGGGEGGREPALPLPRASLKWLAKGFISLKTKTSKIFFFFFGMARFSDMLGKWL